MFCASFSAKGDNTFHPLYSAFSHLCKKVSSCSVRWSVHHSSFTSEGFLNTTERSFIQSCHNGWRLGILSLILFTAWNTSSRTHSSVPNTSWTPWTAIVNVIFFPCNDNLSRSEIRWSSMLLNFKFFVYFHVSTCPCPFKTQKSALNCVIQWQSKFLINPMLPVWLQ